MIAVGNRLSGAEFVLGRPLNPGEQAVLDQWTTALHDGDQRWPYNERVQSDPRMEQLLLDGLRGPEGWPWQSLHPGTVWLVWPAALTVTACPADADIASIASATFPKYGTPCERCGRASLYAALVMNAGAVLVGVLLCPVCAGELEQVHGREEIKWTYPGRGH